MTDSKDIFAEQDLKKNFVARLQELAGMWQKKWSAVMEHRQTLLKLWASGYYDRGYQREHLINLVDRGVSTIVPYFIEGDPRIMVEPLAPKLRPYAHSRQLAINFLIEKNNFADRVFIPAATNSLFGSAIARTFYVYDRCVSLNDEKIKRGTPTVIIIDDSDYIGDPSCKREADFAFEGDIYRLPTDYAKDLFAGKDESGNEIADYISPDCELITKFSPEEISATGSIDFNQLALKEYTTFIDVYLRDENTIITIMPEGRKAKVLKEIDWKGPSGGPYDKLGYKYFPDTPIPIAPAWSWHDLDVSINILARTAREQAESQKTVITAEPAAKDAAEQIVNAKNLDVILAKNTELVKAIQVGGVNPENYNWINWAELQFTKSGTNPDVLGGRQAQAPTLGQEQMVFANASRVINSWYNKFQGFMTSVLRKWAWMVDTDPSTYVEILEELKLPGIGTHEIPVIYSKPDKVGDFYDFVYKIIPYSTQRTSPELRYQKLMQFLGSWVLPTAQLAAAQGAQIDIPLVTRIMADYLGETTFPQWYRSMTPTGAENIDFTMQPSKNKKGGYGQMPDNFGATQPSREANAQRYESEQRAGVT